MTDLRITRAARACLIAERMGRIELTGRGRRLSCAFATLRRFFGHDTRPSTPALLVVARVFSVAVFAAALLWPPAWVIAHGATLTGVNEESTGYRYFYTLRELYEPPVFLFLPQGQLTNLVQKAIQLLLTLAGLPITQLRPRIDYFCYASVAAFHLINVAAFAFLSMQLRTAAACIASALFWAVPFYVPQLSGFYTLLQPDYIALDVTFALIAAGAILKVSRGGKTGATGAALFGLALAIAAATKVTLALLPAAAFGYAMLRVPYSRWDFPRNVAVAAFVAAAGWFCIVFLDYGLSSVLFLAHVKTLTAFMTTGGALPQLHDLSAPAWLIERALAPPPWIAAIYLASPLALICMALCRSRDQLTLAGAFFLTSLAWTAFLYSRDYPATLLEAAFAFHLFLYSVAAIILRPRLDRWPVAPLAVGYVLAAGFAAVLIKGALFPLMSILQSAMSNTTEQASLAAVQRGIAGKHLWIIVDNAFRPLSIDSAIMKGGLVPGSPLMRLLSNDTDFRFLGSREPIQLTEYSAVFFPFNAPLDAMVDLMSRQYSVALDQWRCRPAAQISGQMIGVCEP